MSNQLTPTEIETKKRVIATVYVAVAAGVVLGTAGLLLYMVYGQS